MCPVLCLPNFAVFSRRLAFPLLLGVMASPPGRIPPPRLVRNRPGNKPERPLSTPRGGSVAGVLSGLFSVLSRPEIH